MTEPGQEKVYRYIWGILTNNNCHLYRIGGMEDHLQLVTHIHPTVAVANLIKDIKLATSEIVEPQGSIKFDFKCHRKYRWLFKLNHLVVFLHSIDYFEYTSSN